MSIDPLVPLLARLEKSRPPSVALFIKWEMRWSGPLWHWAVRSVDRWHERRGPECSTDESDFLESYYRLSARLNKHSRSGPDSGPKAT